MPVKNAHQIKIGCDDWDEPLVLGRDSTQIALGTLNHTASAPVAELLSIDHHLVLTQTLTQFDALKSAQTTKKQANPCELSLYFTKSERIRQINLDYRGKDKATNVLSFDCELPTELLKELDFLPLGELVFSLEVIAQEALDQGKTLADHYTHLLVHGCLHLLGLDHEISECDQAQMEALEIKILAGLGIANPFEG